eukprot:jgi/Mesvir1/3535/Mv12006-RA.1
MELHPVLRVENHELIKKPKVEVDVAPVGLVENAEEVKKPKVEEENAEDVKTPGKLEEVAPINFRETFTVEMARIQFKKEPGNSYNAFIADVLNGSTWANGVTPQTEDFARLKHEFVTMKLGCDHEVNSSPVVCNVWKTQGHFFFSAVGHITDYRVSFDCVMATLRNSSPLQVFCPLCEVENSKHRLEFPYFRYDVAQSGYAAVINELATKRTNTCYLSKLRF